MYWKTMEKAKRKEEQETEKNVCWNRKLNQRHHAHQYTQNKTDVKNFI